jgi:hypothetical protein
MQAAMRTYTDDVRRTRGLELRMRVGLHCGPKSRDRCSPSRRHSRTRCPPCER